MSSSCALPLDRWRRRIPISFNAPIVRQQLSMMSSVIGTQVPTRSNASGQPRGPQARVGYTALLGDGSSGLPLASVPRDVRLRTARYLLWVLARTEQLLCFGLCQRTEEETTFLGAHARHSVS